MNKFLDEPRNVESKSNEGDSCGEDEEDDYQEDLPVVSEEAQA